MISVSSDIEGDIVLPATTKTHRLDKEKLQAMAEFHGAMYINNDNLTRVAATKNAERDITAIYLAFPAVQVESILLAMAAWLSVLRNVNDEVERLDANTAQLALTDSAAILTSSIRSSSRSPQRYGGACLDPACDAVYMHVIGSVLDVWDVMLAEVLVRDASAVDVEAYLEDRTGTIGFRPFIVLLQADVSSDRGGLLEERGLQEMEWMM
ncbi:hypothetical protein LTR48_001411 [Friedmanniomyces endolithicus]|nr:hypothetical protein LTS09_011419 [Friedmanniomyces endolithicus]KAK0926940.1 hypothetical protein LTR29_017752 [Friedmanniomyces endolithicus]KAK1088575.1 hypothetical protein LTR48_001411 [Friedmanniomyces endolithicus]